MKQQTIEKNIKKLEAKLHKEKQLCQVKLLNIAKKIKHLKNLNRTK